MDFDYSQDFSTIDFRVHPERYQVGKGEQGVLMVEPYKSEILPHWRFRTPEVAQVSSEKIYRLFLKYKKEGDFVGMDMARKFLQMGFTRARRYANHPSGRKYKKGTNVILPSTNDPEKAKAATIFYEAYLKAREDKVYKAMKEEWVKRERAAH
jgi:hypothetical protein